jgi:hypothetical protein
MVEAPYPLVPVPGKKDWLDDHPRRRILIGGLLVLALGLVFIGGVLCLVEYSFHHHTVTQQAIERVESDPRIMQAIGEPLRVGWVIKGNIHMKDSNGYADLRIPISGPRGAGMIVLYARETLGTWTFRALRVDLDDSTTINLM